MHRLRARTGAAALLLGALHGPLSVPSSSDRTVHAQGVRSVSLTARRYAFTPNRIEVTQGDLVRIELRTDDIAHSLTIDDYRLSKRVIPKQPVALEFRAERAGTFPFYCSLQIDEGCRRMRGEFVVRPR
jgi:heme/copper-type cytochrome/quinol oxidase subunit 2